MVSNWSVHRFSLPTVVSHGVDVYTIWCCFNLFPPQLNDQFLSPALTAANFSLWSGCCGVQNLVWPPCFVLPHCNTFTDVEDVKFVINYDYPNSSEDYIHRIGRTARSQKTGTAYTFFTPNNMKQASDLISVLREANQAINPKLIQMAEDRGGTVWYLFTLICL